MSHEIENIKIADKLEKLKIQLPNGLIFLPENFETAENKDQFIFTESMVNLAKIFRQRNIETFALGGDTEQYRSRKNADIYFPLILFSASQISQNPDFISVCLNILSDYISDHFKGVFGQKKVYADFYVETKEKGKIKRLSYKGDVQGLKELPKILKNL
ncbi:hypothetical protein [Olivibacter jilunii]|uniref:hypothetical protein n=1 Tax=Olivibacter jilunii TaxID=985016 RepID=UPI00102F936A|nr:hypothetical protein [Olivibacter jilunii]